MLRRAHYARAGTRLVVTSSFGLLVAAVTSALAPWQVAVLVGWSTAAGAFIAWVLWAAYGQDGAGTAMLATREDDSRAAADLALVGACLASLAGVGVGLVKAGQERGAAKAATTGLAVLTVLLSWAAVHAVFTLR